MIRCLLIGVTEGRHEYGWKLEARVSGGDPGALSSVDARGEKGIILQEFCAVCDYHRKHAIRLLNQQKRGPTKRPGRKRVYRSAELLTALRRLWLATDQICSKKLVAAIPLWLPFYEGTYEKLSATTTDQLLSVSAATIDRRLAPTRAKTRPRGRCATKPGRLLRNHFCPTLKLLQKKRINSKYYKKYDKPKTPFQRLMTSREVTQEDKDTVKKQHLSLDPFKLRQQIEQQLKTIFKLVSVTSNVRKRI